MKKLSLLLVVLLAAGSAGLYGQMAIGTNFVISGEATATAGYDMDDERFGFKNESESDIKIEFVAEQSTDNAEMVGMEGWVGSIELKDFKIIIDSAEEDSDLYVKAHEATNADVISHGGEKKAGRWIGGVCSDGSGSFNAGDYITLACLGEPDKRGHSRSKLVVSAPDITATLRNGPLWMQIFDAPSNEADLVAHVESDEDGDRAAESHDEDQDVGLDLTGAGVKVGYTTDDLSIAVGMTSDEAYDSANEGSFVVSADLGVNVGPAHVDLAFVQGLKNEEDTDLKADDTGVGANLTTDFGDISLSVGVDVHLTGEEDDVETTTNESMDYDLGGDVTVTLTPNTTLTANFINSTLPDTGTDVKVNLGDESGLVERLKMMFTWGLFDLAGGYEDSADKTINDQMDMFVEGKLDYALDLMGGTLTPGTTVTVNQLDGGAATVGLEVRSVLTEAVPATEFGLKWETERLFDVDSDSPLSGTVTAWTKITY